MANGYTVYAIRTDDLGVDVTAEDVARMDALLEHEIAASALAWRARVIVSDANGYSVIRDYDDDLRTAVARAFDRFVAEGASAAQ